MKEEPTTIAVEIPKTLHHAVVEICNVKSNPNEFICQAIVDRLKQEILKYHTAIGFAQQDLDCYEEIDHNKKR